MRHLFVVGSLQDKHIQNEKELVRPRRLLPAAGATRARSAQFCVVLIRHSTGKHWAICLCVRRNPRIQREDGLSTRMGEGFLS